MVVLPARLLLDVVRLLPDRARARELDSGRVSDATVEIAEREGRRWESLDEIDPGSLIALRIDRDGGQIVAELAESLEPGLAGGTG